MIPPEDLLLNENPSDSLWYTSLWVTGQGGSKDFQEHQLFPLLLVGLQHLMVKPSSKDSWQDIEKSGWNLCESFFTVGKLLLCQNVLCRPSR